MKSRQFFIVDVFATEKYGGNQLAVVTGAAGLTDEEMQQIALEMNYSETTFILGENVHQGGFDVRIFTPAREVPFAGHPTLGTAYVIARERGVAPPCTIRLNLAVGQIPVTIQESTSETPVLWMHQNPPVFGDVIDPAEIADLLSLDETDIDTRFPVEEVSTGLWFVIVPLTTRDAVQRARIESERHDRFIIERNAKAIFIFCPETVHPGHDLHARMFAPYYGVSEDPATGSAAGCLAGYLVHHRYFQRDTVELRMEQGYAIKRPSLLLLNAAQSGERIDVRVGGKVYLTARGTLE